MENILCPVDVIAMCSAAGELRPLRLRLEDSDGSAFRVDIQEILHQKEIPYPGVEAHIFLCQARAQGRDVVVELKYSIRSHSWCLLRKLQYCSM